MGRMREKPYLYPRACRWQANSHTAAWMNGMPKSCPSCPATSEVVTVPSMSKTTPRRDLRGIEDSMRTEELEPSLAKTLQRTEELEPSLAKTLQRMKVPFS